MKKTVAPITVVLLFAFAASASAQEATHFSTTSAPGARIESQVTMSSEPDSVLSADACTANATTLCLNNSRFQARAIFSAPTLGIMNAPAQAVPLTGDTGYFWFFSANNVEITLKVVDGRTFNGFFWAFYAALSDVAYTITITDMDTGVVKTYSNSQGSLASVADVTAFSGGPSCTYNVLAAAPSSFGSNGGTGTINVLTQSGCTWTAASNSSFVTITSGASGNGNGTVFFSVAANSSTTARTGSLTVAGQTVSVTQSGVSSSGNRDGDWTGTNSLTCDPASAPPGPCGMSWTIANNAFTRFQISHAGPCGIVDGGTTINYTTPLPISGNSFTISSSGSPPVRISFTVNGTFNSNSSVSGTGTVTFTTSSPLPSCTATVPITFSATKP